MNNREQQNKTKKELKKWTSPKIITISKEELQKCILTSACSGYGGCTTLGR